MAWWQKKLLRYALSRTGLLDDKVLDLDKLDIALGKKNVVELKEVGLNIERISKLAQLPPSLRIESARVLSLRLTVPADIYQSSIIAEVDGVELNLRLDEKDKASTQEQRGKDGRPTSSRDPSHRKVPRRIHSPRVHDPGGSAGYDDLRIPTTEELAKSFLLEEPVQNRRELEASVVAGDKNLEESVVSDSSDGGTLGTGGAIGLPGFLSDFLQGIVDRLQVSVKNVEAKLHTEISGSDDLPAPVTLHLHVGNAEFGSVSSDGANEKSGAQLRQRVSLVDMSLNLVTDATFFSELSEMPSHVSPAESRRNDQSPQASRALQGSFGRSSRDDHIASPTDLSTTSSMASETHTSPKSPDTMRESILTLDDDRFADAGEDDLQSQRNSANNDLEIQPGDDNITWGSRRSKASAPVEDLWSSTTSEDAMPESLLLPPTSKSRLKAPAKPVPRAARTGRDVSPFGRSFQSPGSWPRLDESPQRQRYQTGTGSWPTMDQSQQSLFQPLTSESISSTEEAVDNKLAALEMSTAEVEKFDTPPELAAEGPDALATSMIFTHEDAKSMYASAMAHSSKMHVPGGWASEDDQSESPPAPSAHHSTAVQHSTELHERLKQVDDDLAYGEQPFNTPGNTTPRGPTPDLPEASDVAEVEHAKKTSRQLLLIDRISVLLPLEDEVPNAEENSEPIIPADVHSNRSRSHMPGAFSMYSEMSASQRYPAEVTRQGSSTVIRSPHERSEARKKMSPLQITIGFAKAQLDMSCGRLLYRLVSKFSETLASNPTSQAPEGKANETTSMSVSLSITDVWLAFKESTAPFLDTNGLSEPIENLVTVGCRDFEFSTIAQSINIRLGSFVTYLGPSRFISFNRSQNMTTSVIMDDKSPEVALTLTTKATEKRPVMEVAIEMLPLDVALDLPILDETFNTFGGLSGLLEAGNSVLSESGITSSPSSPTKLAKGVRFHDDAEAAETTMKLKANARIAGICAMIRSSEASVHLQTTTLRAIYREYGVSATMSHISLKGPYLKESEAASVSIDLSTLRIEYLESAQHYDIDRLLNLLMPSNDKYDNDDDVLLDTLIRQRKKAAVIRASLDSLKIKCEDLDWISPLTTFGSELSKLSVVTKYLPEDERPGILSFVQVKALEAHVPMNPQFGTLRAAVMDLQLAHIGLPALFAFSLGTIKASQMGHGALVHELVPPSASENFAMVMGRMLGDETIKVKLFNVCVEYSVQTLLELSTLDEGIDTEEMVAELAKSMANLAEARKDGFAPGVLTESDTSNGPSKSQKIDLIIHDSGIGLSPRDLTSKALLVLTDAYVSTVVPPTHKTMVQIDFRKAGLFVADQVFPDGINAPLGARSSPSNSGTKPKLTLALAKHGFVSVGSVMAAKILVNISGAASSTEKTMYVQVQNELLLLETCADSTQTLIAIMNGLSPPKSPSKQPKYLTEPMTIEDMMASFTGEAFEKPVRRPNTLFDVDEEPEEFDLPNHPGEDNDNDSLLAESEMTDSLYGPVSGILGVADPSEQDVNEDNMSETVESLLEDDPFEMTMSPADYKLSDAALLRELNKQSKPVVSNVSIELDPYEPKDLGIDAASVISKRRGLQSDRNVRIKRTQFETRRQELPFRLQLRDLHIIWNIYDGYDWPRTRDGITQAVEQVEVKAEERRLRRRQPGNESDDEESVIGDFLFNSIYIGIPGNHDTQDLRRQINRGIDDLASETESMPVSAISKPTTVYSSSGRPLQQRQRKRLKLERSRAHKVAFELKGVSVDILVYPEDSGDVVSSVDVRIKDFEIFDNVPTSTWRKFLTQISNEPGTREMAKPMLHLELFNVRTLENFAASEITMHVSVLPLRLHVDQDALDFITRFFEFKDDSAAIPDNPSEQPFIQRLEIDTVDLRLDYKPKKVDYGGLRSGHTTEFMNFIILEAANIRLRHAIVYGIKGFEPLHKTLNDIWMPDVKRNQLPTVLAGLAPVRSLVNIGSGVRDVVAIPVREYRKDGRVVRSIQKGAFEFGKTTASELARLGAKVAIGTQTLLKGAEGLLTPTSASPSRASPRRYSSDQPWQDADSPNDEHESRAISAYANQPLNVFSGLLSARKHLEYDLLTARDALIAVQGEVLESSGPGAAAAAVAKYAPTVILRPIIGTSRAVGTALLGVGNQIDRSNVRRIEDKYKRR